MRRDEWRRHSLNIEGWGLQGWGLRTQGWRPVAGDTQVKPDDLVHERGNTWRTRKGWWHSHDDWGHETHGWRLKGEDNGKTVKDWRHRHDNWGQRYDNWGHSGGYSLLRTHVRPLRIENPVMIAENRRYRYSKRGLKTQVRQLMPRDTHATIEDWEQMYDNWGCRRNNNWGQRK